MHIKVCATKISVMAKHLSGGSTIERETARYGTVIVARITTDPKTRASEAQTFRIGTLTQRRKAAGDWLTKTAKDIRDGYYTPQAVAARAAAQEAAKVAAANKAKEHTLRSWAEHTLTVNTKRSEATREQYRTALQRHLEPFLDLPLTELSVDALEAHYAQLVAKGSGPVSIARSNAALSGILTDAVRKRLLTLNVARLVDLPEAPETAPKTALDAAQVAKLLAHTDCTDLAAAFRVAVSAGLRRSELVALRWDVIDLEAGTIRVVRTATLDAKGQVRNTVGTKTAKQGRTVAIGGKTVSALRSLLTAEKAKAAKLGLLPWATDRPVFTDDAAQQIRPDWFSDEVRRACKAVGIPEVTAHALRHTNGTILANAGVDVLTISRHLGHSSTRVTESTYIHELAARERTAADAIDALVG